MASMYFTMFWIPAISSAILLVVHFNSGELSNKEMLSFMVWYAVSLILQLFARNSVMWIAGFVSQVILALALAIKWNMSL